MSGAGTLTVDVNGVAIQCWLSPEAPVNDSDNYNRSKVRHACNSAGVVKD